MLPHVYEDLVKKNLKEMHLKLGLFYQTLKR